MTFDFDEFEDLLAENLAPAPLPTFSVSQFVDSANQIFETAMPLVQIEGEVSSFKINQGKFVFFDLKDKDATISCFMTLWQLKIPLRDGMNIIATAKPKMTNWGKFSLTIMDAKLRGEGDLLKNFEILKKKLQAEGVFDQDKKQPIPVGSKNIGAISSVQAAGYADFVKIINQRWGGARVRVAHTQVQGAAAAGQICRAIDFFNNLQDPPEVIAIIRGGGSKEDLAAFDDEVLARKISLSKIPIITGIGHEIDQTLADLAADMFAATPSHAAQILTPDKNAEIDFLRGRLMRLGESLLGIIQEEKLRQRSKIEDLGREILRQIQEKKAEISSKKRLLESLNPDAVLKKGYALVRGFLQGNSQIEIETDKEIILAEVKNVRKK